MKLVPREKLNDYIGKEIGCSDWFLVDQEQINKFAQSLEGLNFQNVKTELDGLGDSFRKVVQETENMALSTKTATSKLAKNKLLVA